MVIQYNLQRRLVASSRISKEAWAGFTKSNWSKSVTIDETPITTVVAITYSRQPHQTMLITLINLESWRNLKMASRIKLIYQKA